MKIRPNSWQTPQTCSENIPGKREMEKVDVNFLGLFLSPTSTEAICFDLLHFEWHDWNPTDSEDPLPVHYTEIQEKPKEEKKNQWSFLLMSLQDVVSRRLKEFFRIPADSPQASSVSQKKVRWWIYLRDSNVIFLQDNSCKQESKSQERLFPLWLGVYNLRSVQVKLWLLQQ